MHRGRVVDEGWLCWDVRRNAPRLNCRKWRMKHDYWLAGSYERRLVEDMVRREFNASYSLQGKVMVVHRAPKPSPDAALALELFADGVRLGVVEYRLGEGWRLHPSGGLASLLHSTGVQVVEAESSGRRVKGKKVRVSGDVHGAKWVILDLGRHVGVGRVIDADGRVVKVKDVVPKGFKPLQASSSSIVVDVNRDIVEEAVEEASVFLEKATGRVTGSIAVSYSGGADSTATLMLAGRVIDPGRLIVVYVDTGMDLPGVKEYSMRVLGRLGVNPYVVSSGLDPLAEIASRGLPTRENRWCTRILKLEPLRRFYSEHGVKLVIEGARSRESSGRAATPRIGENPLIPGVIRVLPIKHWSRLLVQLYLISEGVELNPLYDEGFTRLGCILCPAMHPHELELSFSKHREWFTMLEERTGLTLRDIVEAFYSVKHVNGPGGI
ncbi:phosphoadenosine phosphosulfate reductase family protein [Desulfurococcus mucosus]|uniref:phosphoadenosine phosphosulfate reductase domain-containing protein n=1 Tax=Desulfurococcus mucosus TaxID=2275 RepID=UPI001FE1D3D0|nr:phosphoadenosine phosphosulfate reductase family protein [Desulfurococcus mucosus]